MEELIQQRLAQKEAELNATYDERIHNYQERCVILPAAREFNKTHPFIAHCKFYRERDLQRQLNLTKDQLRELRTSNESTQAKLLDHSQRQGAACRSTKPIYSIHLQFILFYFLQIKRRCQDWQKWTLSYPTWSGLTAA
jgi:hypothetical protein